MRNIVLLIIIFLCLETFICYKSKAEASSLSDVKNIYRKLCKGVKCPPLVILNSKTVNAYSFCNYIAINKGMLYFTKNKAELAFIIGHELGHYFNNDCIKIHTFQTEYNADKFSMRLIKSKFINQCKAIKIFKRFIKYKGNNTTLTHPMFSLREGRFYCYRNKKL